MRLRALVSLLVASAIGVASCSRERELPDYRPEIQLLREHIVAVLDVMDEFSEPQLLVWGVGYDSKLWCNENPNGETIFIEDSPHWARLARNEMGCRIVMVQYGTLRTQAEELLGHPELLTLDLPEDLADRKFDVIVVDAPPGHADDKPGRMKSIYMSQVLSHEGSHVFVDDFGRRVERMYADAYLASVFGEPVVLSGRNGFAHYHRLDAR